MPSSDMPKSGPDVLVNGKEGRFPDPMRYYLGQIASLVREVNDLNETIANLTERIEALENP